jgi:transposase
MKREPRTAAKGERESRRRFGAKFKRELVEKTLLPGTSVAAIALEHRLNANLLFKWRRDHMRRLAHDAAATKMLPVVIEAPVVASTPPRGTSSVIEIELSAGRVRLKGAVDAEALRVVIELLSRRRLLCRRPRGFGLPPA